MPAASRPPRMRSRRSVGRVGGSWRFGCGSRAGRMGGSAITSRGQSEWTDADLFSHQPAAPTAAAPPAGWCPGRSLRRPAAPPAPPPAPARGGTRPRRVASTRLPCAAFVAATRRLHDCHTTATRRPRDDHETRVVTRCGCVGGWAAPAPGWQTRRAFPSAARSQRWARGWAPSRARSAPREPEREGVFPKIGGRAKRSESHVREVRWVVKVQPGGSRFKPMSDHRALTLLGGGGLTFSARVGFLIGSLPAPAPPRPVPALTATGRAGSRLPRATLRSLESSS